MRLTKYSRDGTIGREVLDCAGPPALSFGLTPSEAPEGRRSPGRWRVYRIASSRFAGAVLRLALLPGLYLAAGCAHDRNSTASAPIAAPTLTANTATNTITGSPAPGVSTNRAPGFPALNPSLPTLFIAGDSTAARGAGERQQGWAVPFAEYFDPSKVNIANRARGGRSSRTFITEGSWDRLLAEVKPGDLVLIQFGHNDGGAINDTNRARGSLPGLGEETQEIDNLLTKKHEVVHTFGWYLRKMIADSKAKGATPIVLSLTVRNVWKDSKIERGSGRFSQWSAEVAQATGVQFIDVTGRMADTFDAMGEEKVNELYPRDHTHFNAEGADLHAQAVVAGLKGLRPDPVRGFLSPKGEAIAAAQPVLENQQGER